MTITLRDYQIDCIDRTRQALRIHRNVLLQAPTGSGKTAMASTMLQTAASKKKRGYFICHRRELVDQTAKTFDKVGIKYGYIAAGYPQNFYEPIQICSIDTLKNRLDKIPVPDLCVWDEAHHLGAAGWTRVHSHYSDAYHVGLSATPSRLDGTPLGDNFDSLIPGPAVAWLIEEGFLAEYKLYSIPGVDLSGLHTRMGDYVTAEAEQAMDKPTITGNIIQHWKKYANGRKTIGFAVSVAHSKHIVEQFVEAGIRAIHLDGKTPKEERRRLLQDFARGKYQVVFNVGLFAEGFDIAANSGMDVTIGCVIDAAPTQAVGAWLQRCGRTLRPQDEPAIILDHAGNIKHGLPCQERKWTLAGRDKATRSKDDDEASVMIKQCPKCYHCHTPALACPDCGHVYEIKSRKINEQEGELQEIDPAQFRKQARMEQGQAKTVTDLVQQGYSAGRAEHIIKARQEKLALQTELYNLQQGARSAGITVENADISRMKPKALREGIEYLRGVLS
jgi:superfamily II DNA or RNA helicase